MRPTKANREAAAALLAEYGLDPSNIRDENRDHTGYDEMVFTAAGQRVAGQYIRMTWPKGFPYDKLDALLGGARDGDEAAEQAEGYTLPARLLLQVREGVPNVLAEWDLEARDEKVYDQPDENGATREHRIDLLSIAQGLAWAFRDIVVRQVEADPDSEGTQYLVTLIDYMRGDDL